MNRKEFSIFSQKNMRNLFHYLKRRHLLGIIFYEAMFIFLVPLQNKLKFELFVDFFQL